MQVPRMPVPRRTVQCQTDGGHWDCIQHELGDMLYLVVYHSSSYHDTQCWAFGLRTVPTYAVYSESLARLVDHKIPSGV